MNTITFTSEEEKQLYFQSLNNSQQKEKELERFKQDCRKKAIEMAHSESLNLTSASMGAKGEGVDIIKLADKYYKWLIDLK